MPGPQVGVKEKKPWADQIRGRPPEEKIAVRYALKGWDNQRTAYVLSNGYLEYEKSK